MNIKNLVKILFAIVLVLILLGAILVFSASSTVSAVKFNNIYFLFKLHLWKVIASLIVLIIFSVIPYEVYKTYSKHLLIITVFLLLATLLTSAKVKGAARWLNLGIIQFQPSDLAKIVLIIYLAKIIEKKEAVIQNFERGLKLPLIITTLFALLVMLQPNMSTTILIVLLAFIMLYIGGARFKHLFYTASSVFAVLLSVMMFFSHSRQRIYSFVDSFTGSGDAGWQVQQAKVALGSGGLFGVGLGHSRQSDLFIPESYGDFIFSILGEELGFIGGMTILVLFFLLFFIGIVIAKKTPDKFGQLLAFGISFNIVLNAFINAGVVMGVLPTTGITLPFISYGGTSIIIFASSIGILINIALKTNKSLKLMGANV